MEVRCMVYPLARDEKHGYRSGAKYRDVAAAVPASERARAMKLLLSLLIWEGLLGGDAWLAQRVIQLRTGVAAACTLCRESKCE